MKLVGRNNDGTGERMEVLELERDTHPYFMGAQVILAVGIQFSMSLNTGGKSSSHGCICSICTERRETTAREWILVRAGFWLVGSTMQKCPPTGFATNAFPFLLQHYSLLRMGRVLDQLPAPEVSLHEDNLSLRSTVGQHFGAFQLVPLAFPPVRMSPFCPWRNRPNLGEHPASLVCRFVLAQYHPEFKSRPHKPSPLFTGLLRAAGRYADDHDSETFDL